MNEATAAASDNESFELEAYGEEPLPRLYDEFRARIGHHRRLVSLAGPRL
jgi:hypothetical protein